MKITNLDFDAAEESQLFTLAQANGHDPATLSPPNLVRAAFGFSVRKRGGARENTGPKPNPPKRQPRKKK